MVYEIHMVIQAPGNQRLLFPSARPVRQLGKGRTVGTVGLRVLGEYAVVREREYFDFGNG